MITLLTVPWDIWIRSKVKLDELVENSPRGAAIWDEVKDRLKKSALGLSGGQQQRICIARALAVQPEVLLMDEPTSALDPISTAKVEELALELKKDYTIVMVTHNMQQAARISDRTAFFLLGEVVEFGKTEQIFSHAKGQTDRGLYYREVWMMKTKFDEQLEEMHVELIKMGSLCEQAITLSSRTLLGDEKNQVEQVYSVDSEIDQQEREIENICMRLLLRSVPLLPISGKSLRH